jgi:cobalt-zinc-cadmium efflux system protein
LDGQLHYATIHVVTNDATSHIKEKIREELLEHGIVHATLELESADEECHAKTCRVESAVSCEHHHHHHH